MAPRPPFRLTLIEILILIVIAATLATIAIPRIMSRRHPPAVAPLETQTRAPGGARDTAR
jgi:hypothetical protein